MTGLQEIPKKITSNSQEGRRVLKSWEERLAEVMATAPTEELPTVVRTGPACLIQGCTTPAVDIAYCAEHRRMADDGSLWLCCVFCQAPVAPNDPIACAEDRVRLDAEGAR